MEVLSGCGHAVHEDQPSKVSYVHAVMVASRDQCRVPPINNLYPQSESHDIMPFMYANACTVIVCMLLPIMQEIMSTYVHTCTYVCTRKT